jgi:hypothetical protein
MGASIVSSIYNPHLAGATKENEHFDRETIRIEDEAAE